MSRGSFMLEFEVERKYSHPADMVWEVTGDFGGLQSWLPGVLGCRIEGQGAADRGGNAVRVISVMDGSVTRERLEALDHAGRSYSYSILESRGFDADNQYYATFRVMPQGDECCLVRWGARFRLPIGMPARKSKQLCDRIAAMYSMCLDNLDVALARY